VIVYRRTRERMPALDFEVEEALEEGVLVKWLSTIKQAGDGELTIEKMVLDEKGNPQPTGELETLKADSLVLALGQDVDLALLEGVPGLVVRDGVVQVDPETMMTGHAGLFAGGDMVPADRNVTVAIGHGKKAARHIDAWLRGTRIKPVPKHAPATWSA
jgi:thioredoxin reductase